MKRFFLLVIALALITVFMTTVRHAEASQLDYNLKVKVNGNLVNFPDQRPFIDNKASRTFVPLRFVSEALGCTVDWQDDSKTAIVDRAGTFIEMKIGSSRPLVNNESKLLDAPARAMNGRTMVPLRFVSEALGAYVDWDGKTRTVYISDVPREAIDPVSGRNNDTIGGTIIKVEDGGGMTDTSPVDDTPWTPWGI